MESTFTIEPTCLGRQPGSITGRAGTRVARNDTSAKTTATGLTGRVLQRTSFATSGGGVEMPGYSGFHPGASHQSSSPAAPARPPPGWSTARPREQDQRERRRGTGSGRSALRLGVEFRGTAESVTSESQGRCSACGAGSAPRSTATPGRRSGGYAPITAVTSDVRPVDVEQAEEE